MRLFFLGLLILFITPAANSQVKKQSNKLPAAKVPVKNEVPEKKIALSQEPRLGGVKTLETLTVNISATDPNGNLYATGSLRKRSFLSEVGVDTSAFSGPGVFIEKLDSSGNVKWVKRMVGEINIKSFTIDAESNLFVTGAFKGSIDFDPGPDVNMQTQKFPYGKAIYVQKLSAEGNLVWIKCIDMKPGIVLHNGIDAESGTSVLGIATDRSGNVFVTGAYIDTVDFDPGPGDFYLSSPIISALRWGNMYILKLDRSGNFIWVKTSHSDDKAIMDTKGKFITTDPSGNIYTMGGYQGNIDFDPGVGIFNLSGAGSFIQKLDNNGNFIWAKGFEFNLGKMKLNETGTKIYLAGQFANTVDFDPGPGFFSVSATYGQSPQGDAFIEMIDSSGAFDWVATFGQSTGNDYINSIAIDAAGNVYSTGYVNGLVTYNGKIQHPAVKNVNTGSFVQKLDKKGMIVWMRNIRSRSESAGYGSFVSITKNQEILITGVLMPGAIVDFDPGPEEHILPEKEVSRNFMCKWR